MLTSFVPSAIFFILTLALLVFLVMKGVNLIAAAMISSAILAFSVEGGWINAFTSIYATGVGNYVSNLFIPFMTGGIFGSIMIASGSDVVIGKTLINRFGKRFAVICMGAFVALLAFAGINSWPYLAAIMAFSLFRACDLPLSIAAVIMVGTTGAFCWICPGAPTTAQVVAATMMGTTTYGGASIGFVMMAVDIVIVYFYVFRLVRRARAKGIGYTATPMEKELRGDNAAFDQEGLPSFPVAIAPMAAVVILCLVFQLVVGLDATASVVIAQIIAIFLCIALNVSRGVHKQTGKAVTNGVKMTAVPLLATCSVVGYATLMSNTTFYAVVIDAVSNMNISPYVMVAIGTAIFAGMGADTISGLSMSLSTIGQKAVEAGANAGFVQRIALTSATTLDSLPHSSAINITVNFLGLELKDVYWQIVVSTIFAPAVATAVGTVMAMIIG